MQSYADSLQALLVVDPEQCNFHAIYLRYFRSIVAVADLQRAVSITLRLPRNALRAPVLEQVQLLLERCIRVGDAVAALRLLGILHAVMDEAEFAAIGFAAAEALRSAGKTASVMPLYGSLAAAQDEQIRALAYLWAGYSCVLAGAPEDAACILDAFPEMSRKDRHFPIYCLVWGRFYLARHDFCAGPAHAFTGNGSVCGGCQLCA